MSTPSRNIELKARVASLAAARRRAVEVATEHLGIQVQTDTYFTVPRGRLKVREIEGEGAALIAYQRDDAAEARPSDFRLVPVPDANGMKEALAATLGIRVIVRKRREVFLYHQVRIHLDQVEGLGDFIEFEAVVAPLAGSNAPAADRESGYERLGFLGAHFGIAAEDLVESSYGDLLSRA